MAILIGSLLALFVGIGASITGLHKVRAFYPAVVMVVALFYVLFALNVHDLQALRVELAVMTLFTVAALAGFRGPHWILAAALGAHALFDSVHGLLIANPGVPTWWPGFCLAYDLTAAFYLALQLHQEKRKNVMHAPESWPDTPQADEEA